MTPSPMASATRLLGSAVLMPTITRPTSTISQVCRYLRVALSLSDSHTRLPGSQHPMSEPVFGHAAVITPVGSWTSARNRL